jgi:streptogramin lyase
MRKPACVGLVLAAAALAVPGAAAVTGVSTITAVAGNGTAGFSGDNGPADAAGLNAPSGVAVDARGQIYIADDQNNRVRVVSNGTITTIAGSGTAGYSGDGGPASAAQLFGPAGVAVAGNGDVYIADTLNDRIRKVSGGTITTFAGTGTPGFSGDRGPATAAELRTPYGVAVDRHGNVYVADTGNNRVREVSGGTITTIAGGGSAGCMDSSLALGARLSFPSGVAVDDRGNVFVADNSNGCVREASPDATITTIAGTGAVGYSGDLGPAIEARLDLPWGVAVDARGNVYISDGANAAVRKVDPGGTISTIAGGIPGGASTGDGGPAIDASLALPRGIAIDPQGALYITDVRANVVREIADPLPPEMTPGAPAGVPASLQPMPAAPTGPPPRWTLRVAPGQRLLAQHGVRVIATCDAACSLTLTGTVRISSRRPVLALARNHASLSGAGSRVLVLRLPAAALKRLVRTLRPGVRATATIAVRAADGSGQLATARRTVALSGRRR